MDTASKDGARPASPPPPAEQVLTEGQTRGLRLADPRDIPKTLERIGRRVLRGELNHKLANSYGYLASIAIRAHDVGQLAERIELLEAAIDGEQ